METFLIKTIRFGSAALFILLAILVAITIYLRGDKSVLVPGPQLHQMELHRGRFMNREKAPEFAPQPIPPVWMDPVLPRPTLPTPGASMDGQSKYPPKGCVRD